MSIASPAHAGLAALLERRVSVIVGTRDAGLRPHVMRATGCRMSRDGRRLEVLMPATSGADVLDDLRANGRIAVVFSETHRTLQVKGDDAVVTAPTPEDAALAARYRTRFGEEIAQIGFDAGLAVAMLGADEPLAVIAFTVREVFEQTPGPTAGERIGQADG
jgi:hypothetical protein